MLDKVEDLAYRLRAVMVSDISNSSHSLSDKLWLKAPQLYIQEHAGKFWGREPTFIMSQLSVNPPLFECRLIADEKNNIIGLGLSSTKKEAERIAVIQLCRIIDELRAPELKLLQDRIERALKEPPQTSDSNSWQNNPKMFLMKYASSEVSIEAESYHVGDNFLSIVSCHGVEGLGWASTKKNSARLAFLDACLKLDIDKDLSLQTSTPITLMENLPADTDKYLSIDVPTFRNEPWYSKPKGELHSWAMRRYASKPEYDLSQVSNGAKALYFCKVHVPGDPSNILGLGKSNSSKDAARLAAISFIIKKKRIPDNGLELSVNIDQYRTSGYLHSVCPQFSSSPWIDGPRDEVYSLSMEATGQVPQYKTLQEDKIFKTILQVPQFEYEGKGMGASIKESCKLAAIDFCQWHFEENKGRSQTTPPSSDSMSKLPPPAVSNSLLKKQIEPPPKKSKVAELILKNPQNSENSKDRVNALVKHYKTRQDSPNPSSQSPYSVEVPDVRPANLKEPQRQTPTEPIVSPKGWPNTGSDVKISLERAASKLGFDLPTPIVSRESSNGKSLWRASVEWKLPKGIIRVSSGAKPDKIATFKALESNLWGTFNKAYAKDLEKAFKVKQPEPERKVASPTEVDLRNPSLNLSCPRGPFFATASWLKDPRNIGRLFQTAKLVQGTVDPFEAFIEAEFNESESVSMETIENHSLQILTESIGWEDSPQGKAFSLFRQRLPAFMNRELLLDALSRNQVVIISGPAGTGKSTQIPNIVFEQMALDGFGAQCNILVTEPRRISAIALAHRVAEERGEVVGNRVGYQVRFEKRLPLNFGGITFCTTGIFLNKLRSNPHLVGYSHIIIDEAHERDLLSDFALILLWDLLIARPELRLIVMSASLDVSRHAGYFSHFASTVIEIAGPQPRVTQLFLEDIIPMLDRRLIAAQDAVSFINAEKDIFKVDQLLQSSMLNVPYSLIEAVIGEICHRTDSSESILVFLPGWEEMTTLQKCLFNEDLLRVGYNDPSRFKIYLIHSQMRSFDQSAIFEIPPLGIRKIILATNVAETGITIEDVVHVIDSAKVRVSFHESKVKMRDLSCQWISKSNCTQRSGRAGRTRGFGFYYCLMSRQRFSTLEPIQIPEIMRADLQEVCLLIKSLGIAGTIEEVLDKAMDAPSPINIRNAIAHLQEIGAFTEAEELTPLGALLSKLPLSPTISKMVVVGLTLRCLDPILIIASCMTVGGPFFYSKPRGDFEDDPGEYDDTLSDYRKMYGKSSDESDQVAFYIAFDNWRRNKVNFKGHDDEVEFCRKNCLHLPSLVRISQLRQQLLEILEDSGILSTCQNILKSVKRFGDNGKTILQIVNENSTHLEVIKSAIIAALFPHFGVASSKNHKKMETPDGERAILHPSSINHVKLNIQRSSSKDNTLAFAFQEKIKNSNGVFCLNTTICQPLSLFLFGTESLVNKVKISDKTKLMRTLEGLPCPKSLEWINFTFDGDWNSLLLIKMAFDFSLANFYMRLAASGHCPKGSLPPTGASSLSKVEVEGCEFRDDEIVSFIDKVTRTIAILISSDDNL